MASTQTNLTAWMTANTDVTISLQNGGTVTGKIIDDGTTGDSIIVKGVGAQKGVVIPKAAIVTVPEA